MGLLDDAIRDHIDLLRRRGADPTDIAKAEAEALGPVVREVDAPEHHADDGILSGTGPVPADEADVVEPEPEGVPFEDEAELPAIDLQSSSADQQTENFDIFADEGVDAEADVAIEQYDLDDPSLHAADAAEAPAAPTHAAADDGGEGDILEGTPDFLEESPEHDRLWFEQAPSKDFDFGDE